MKVYSNRNVINDKTKWNDTVKLKNWISLELIEIEGWGFLHSICYASGHMLRWFITVFVVFDISPVFSLSINNSCPWQVSMGLSATVYEFCEHPVLGHPDQPYHCTTPTFKGASGSHLCSAPTTLKSTFEAKTAIQAVPAWNLPGEGFSKYSIYKVAD